MSSSVSRWSSAWRRDRIPSCASVSVGQSSAGRFWLCAKGALMLVQTAAARAEPIDADGLAVDNRAARVVTRPHQQPAEARHRPLPHARCAARAAARR